MTDKSIFRVHRDIADNKTLSYKAKGILVYILSKEDDWEINLEELEHSSTNKIDSLYSGIDELVTHGYITKLPIRDTRGRFLGWEYCVYENPNDPRKKMPVALGEGELKLLRVPRNSLRQKVIKRDRANCRYCGISPDVIYLDHVIPYSLGGKTEYENLVVSCFDCNAKKSGRTPEQAEMILL